MITIVIPTRNRFKLLLRLLASIERSAECHRDSLHVVVVDDASTDATKQLPSEYRSHRVLRHGRQRGPAATRNTGATVARGEWIAFLDDDCVVTRDYIKRLFDNCGSEPYDLIGGPARPLSPPSDLVSEYVDSISFLQTPCRDAEGDYACFPSANLVVRYARFHELGGFDQRFARPGGEDNNLTIRAQRAGLRLTYDLDMAVYHDAQTNVLGFCRRYFNYGFGNALNQRILGLSRQDAGFWTSESSGLIGQALDFFRWTQIEAWGEFSGHCPRVCVRRALAFVRICAYEAGGSAARLARLMGGPRGD